MDTTRTTITEDRQVTIDIDEQFEEDNLQSRLNSLLSANADFSRNQSLYHSDKERFEANSLENPLTSETAFSYFGLLLGTIPPAAFFLKFLFESDANNGVFFVFVLMLLVNITTAVVGYFSGKLVGKLVAELEKLPWAIMLLITPFLGFIWGAITGGLGGIFLFVVGGIFGAVIGGFVGVFALPIFSTLHRLLKRGDKIEAKILLPVAFGLTLTIAALILGFSG